MITLCRTFLSSNQDCLSSVAQQALRHFKPQTEDNKEGNARKLETRLKLLVQVYTDTAIKYITSNGLIAPHAWLDFVIFHSIFRWIISKKN